MRHIVLDTETTGMNAEADDRIIEIGAIELWNYIPTGKIFHHYINPERTIPPEATAVHGITDKDVAHKPIYSEIVDLLDAFIEDSPLVIHNAEFDMRFLNAEYKRLGFPVLPMTRAIDTLKIARQKFPGSPASLDALCKRFKVDLSERTFHGALLDARLLAEVFLHLTGGHQMDMLGGAATSVVSTDVFQKDNADTPTQASTVWPKRNFAVSADEQALHDQMVAGIKEALWRH